MKIVTGSGNPAVQQKPMLCPATTFPSTRIREKGRSSGSIVGTKAHTGVQRGVRCGLQWCAARRSHDMDRSARSGAPWPQRRRQPALSLGALDRLDRLAGTPEREPALTHLVSLVAASRDALRALDFQFGLPVELFPARSRWPPQLALVREYRADDYGLGLECVRRARALGAKRSTFAVRPTSTRERLRPVSLPDHLPDNARDAAASPCGATAPRRPPVPLSATRVEQSRCSWKRARRRRSSGLGFHRRTTSSPRAVR